MSSRNSHATARKPYVAHRSFFILCLTGLSEKGLVSTKPFFNTNLNVFEYILINTDARKSVHCADFPKIDDEKWKVNIYCTKEGRKRDDIV